LCSHLPAARFRDQVLGDGMPRWVRSFFDPRIRQHILRAFAGQFPSRVGFAAAAPRAVLAPDQARAGGRGSAEAVWGYLIHGSNSAQSGKSRKDEQFIHEQNWQKSNAC
jgi:hypothetical protein